MVGGSISTAPGCDALIAAAKQGRQQLEELFAIERQQAEIERMERYLPFLATTASSAPFILMYPADDDYNAGRLDAMLGGGLRRGDLVVAGIGLNDLMQAAPACPGRGQRRAGDLGRYRKARAG